jgi:hypothetical protein
MCAFTQGRNPRRDGTRTNIDASTLATHSDCAGRRAFCITISERGEVGSLPSYVLL